MNNKFKGSATNAALMRQRNEKTILSIINNSSVSRADIAKITGLTKAAVTIIVDELKRRGIITEEKGECTRLGRTPLLLSLAKNSLYVIGINIRRVGIYIGISDICGNILCESSLEKCNPDDAFLKISQTVNQLCNKYSIDRSKIYKVAAVTPGPVDITAGKMLNPPNFSSWHGIEVVKGLSEALDTEVVFGNVSSAVAVAERYFGAAKNCESFLALLIDEGIGSGIIRKGKLFEGACELGHVSVKLDGEKCECGNSGCLERYASIPNILKGTPYNSFNECIAGGRYDIAEKEAEYLGCAIATANNLFDIDSAVLCGELAGADRRFLKLVQGKVRERILTKKDFKILSGTVSSHSLIAASLAVHDFFTP